LYEPIDGDLFQSLVFRVQYDLFQQCRSSMKTHPDYQSSSGSIYKPNATCVQSPGPIVLLQDRTLIPQPRDSNNLISIGYHSQNHFKKSPKASSSSGKLAILCLAVFGSVGQSLTISSFDPARFHCSKG
jgi:hypothetical protein